MQIVLRIDQTLRYRVHAGKAEDVVNREDAHSHGFHPKKGGNLRGGADRLRTRRVRPGKTHRVGAMPRLALESGHGGEDEAKAGDENGQAH